MNRSDFYARCPPPPSGYGSLWGPLSVQAVLDIYFFSDGDCGVDIDNSKTEFSWTVGDGGDLAWAVHLFGADGGRVTGLPDPGGDPIALSSGFQLYRPFRGGPGAGRVGHKAMICLDPKYQQRGVGRLLDQRETTMFQAWGAQELHLEAACEARK